MERFLWIALGVMSFPSFGSAQTAAADTSAVEVSGPTDTPAAPTATGTKPIAPEFVPMTASERARKYLVGAFGPGSILRAAAAGAIAQSSQSPKEWGVGAGAYGDRVGNAFAKHVIREALEYGGSTAFREDNRYFRSTQSGFFKRSKHVVASVFVARNDAGGEHFAYSRFGAALGSSFISRLWQPRSDDSSGDAAVSFGLTMVSDIGWNFFKEFCPRGLTRHFGAH
ncbi:MAG: hypothetical protein LAQ69_28755 [Acidobacteriia bacterium]|nr:hypothetical protein [Terriglobia bacterium]